MGYYTEFLGSLKFTSELTASELTEVVKFLGEDCRDHPEWKNALNLTHVNLKLLDDFSGVEWNGSERTYDLCEKLNMIVSNLRLTLPDFGFEGNIMAQGEDFDDRWEIYCVGGFCYRRDRSVKGRKIECPYCEETFMLEDDRS